MHGMRVASYTDPTWSSTFAVACFRASVESHATVEGWQLHCANPPNCTGAVIWIVGGSFFVLSANQLPAASNEPYYIDVTMRWTDGSAAAPVRNSAMETFSIGEYGVQVAEIVRMGSLVDGFIYHADVGSDIGTRDRFGGLLRIACIRCRCVLLLCMY